MTTLSVVTITNGSPEEVGDIVDHALREIGADEHVIVTTDNHEKLARVARNKGAEVIAHEGEFDYSSPRNLGIEVAEGEWCFHVDTDERVHPVSIQRLPQVIARAGLDNLLVPQDNGIDQESCNQERLHKKSAGLAFKGLVHEGLYPYVPSQSPEILLIHQREDHNLKGVIQRRLDLATSEVNLLLDDALENPTTDSVAEYISRLGHLVGLFLELRPQAELARETCEMIREMYLFSKRRGFHQGIVSRAMFHASKLIEYSLPRGMNFLSTRERSNILKDSLATGDLDPAYINLVARSFDDPSLGDIDEGISLIDTVISNGYDSATARESRAYLLFRKGFFRDAIEEYLLAEKMFPEHPQFRRGTSVQQLKDLLSQRC